MGSLPKKKKHSRRYRTKFYYPVALDIENKLTVVVGGGKVAQLKIQTLLDSKARVRVVSPELAPKLKLLHKSKKVQWVRRTVQLEDIKGAFVVIAATSDKKVNEKVSRWAKKSKILVNVVDQPAMSHFISPALLRKSIALIAVYTNGKSPSLSRDLKNFLKKDWDKFRTYQNSIKKKLSNN